MMQWSPRQRPGKGAHPSEILFRLGQPATLPRTGRHMLAVGPRLPNAALGAEQVGWCRDVSWACNVGQELELALAP